MPDKTNHPDAVHVDEHGVITAEHRLAAGDYIEHDKTAGALGGPCIVNVIYYAAGLIEYVARDY